LIGKLSSKGNANLLILASFGKIFIPVVPHKAVAEVSKIGNL